MYDKHLEAEVFGGKANKAQHDKRMKSAAKERLKRNADWNKHHKSKRKENEE